MNLRNEGKEEKREIKTPEDLFREKFEAAAGNPIAQYELGLMYENGRGVAENKAAALNCFQRAADQKYAAAEHKMGLIYYSGLYGIARNVETAAAYIECAAEQGFVHAEYLLISCRPLAKLTSPSNQTKWFNRAAEHGHPDIQYWKARQYERGNTTDKIKINIQEAVKWYQRAIISGNVNALYSLGHIYETGPNKWPIDYVKAAKFYRLYIEEKLARSDGNHYFETEEIKALGRLYPDPLARLYPSANKKASDLKIDGDTVIYHMGLLKIKYPTNPSIRKIALNCPSSNIIRDFNDFAYRNSALFLNLLDEDRDRINLKNIIAHLHPGVIKKLSVYQHALQITLQDIFHSFVSKENAPFAETKNPATLITDYALSAFIEEEKINEASCYQALVTSLNKYLSPLKKDNTLIEIEKTCLQEMLTEITLSLHSMIKDNYINATYDLIDCVDKNIRNIVKHNPSSKVIQACKTSVLNLPSGMEEYIKFHYRDKEENQAEYCFTHYFNSLQRELLSLDIRKSTLTMIEKTTLSTLFEQLQIIKLEKNKQLTNVSNKNEIYADAIKALLKCVHDNTYNLLRPTSISSHSFIKKDSQTFQLVEACHRATNTLPAKIREYIFSLEDASRRHYLPK